MQTGTNLSELAHRETRAWGGGERGKGERDVVIVSPLGVSEFVFLEGTSKCVVVLGVYVRVSVCG